MKNIIQFFIDFCHVRNMSTSNIFKSVVLAAVMITPSPSRADFPANYEGFDVANFTGNTLETLLSQGKTNILLPQGVHVINNPITIDRTTALVLHGAGRMRTRIQGANPSLPLFNISNASFVSIAGIEFMRAQTSGVIPNQSDIVFSNTNSINTEIQDSFFRAGGIQINGPGKVVIQGTHFDGDHYTSSTTFHRVDHGVVVNHSGASVFVVGGNFNSFAKSHIEQQLGHLEVYGTGMQDHSAGAETADIIIRTPSPYINHAHIIAAVRSEGNYTDYTIGAKLLYVPSTAENVNVVLKNNLLATLKRYSVCSDIYLPDVMADYNAGGNIWLIGNQASDNTKSLVIGNSVGNVYSAGNSLLGCTSVADYFKLTGGAQVFHANELYNHWLNDNTTEGLEHQFIDDDNFTGWGAAPLVPQNINSGNIPIIHKPTFTAGSPAGFLTNACPNGAQNCDIQAALLTNGANIYIPAGTYNLTSPLSLDQSNNLVGGLIAGAGKGNTIIKCSGCSSIFQTNGLSYTTIQGITFQLEDTIGSVISLEWPTSTTLAATQGNNFYDVDVVGGQYGVAIGLNSPQQCSENLFVDSSFSGSSMLGAAIGQYNALSNNFHNVTFSNSPWAVGYDDLPNMGGTWGIFSANINNISMSFIRGGYGGGRTMYNNKITGNAGAILFRGWTSNPFSYFIDNSQIAITPTANTIDVHSGQGVNLIRSSVTGGVNYTNGGGSDNYIHSILSNIENLPPSPLTGPHRVGFLGALSDDADLDGIASSMDNCYSDANPDQIDSDNNGIGDACDTMAQTITVTTSAPLSATYNSSFTVSALASSGLPVTVSTSGGCSNNGNIVTITSGTTACTVNYDQDGDANYFAAPRVSSTTAASKANQTITVTTPAPTSASTGVSFTVAAIASSNLGVTISESGSCTRSGSTVTMSNTATTACTVTYSQVGNDDYNAASLSSTTKFNQTISTGTVPSSKPYNSTFTLSPTASVAPVAVTTSGGCSNNGNTVTMASGTTACTINFDQGGNNVYAAAPRVTRTVTATKISQAITFNKQSPPSRSFVLNNTFSINPLASTTSGLTIAYSSTTTSVCTVAGTTVTMRARGTCTIAANQAGDNNYQAAPQKAQSVRLK